MHLSRLDTRFHAGKLEDDKLGKSEMSYCQMHSRYRGVLSSYAAKLDGDGVGKCD